MRNRIWRALALAGALLFLASGARAQTQTNVTATITDPLGIPYSNGTYSIQLVPTGTNPTVNGNSIGGAFNGSTDANGRFNVSLWPNASIVPGGTTWQFTICTNPGGIAPPLGTGNQCTPPTVVTIAGASQNLSSALSAVAPKLTTITIGAGSVTSVSGTAPIVATPNPINGVGSISCPTCGPGTIGGSIANTQVAFGTGSNQIGGNAGFIFVTPNLSIPTGGSLQMSGVGPFLNMLSEPCSLACLAVGPGALGSLTSGTLDVALGEIAAAGLTSGSSDTATGNGALNNNSTGSNDSAFGTNSLSLVNGGNNSGFGTSSGGSESTGTDNSFFGFQAGFGSVGGTTGSFNVILGEETNTTAAITTGSNNLLFGNSLAAFAAGTAGLSHTGSSQLDIGDVILGTALNTPNSSVITFPGTVHSGTDNTSAGIFRAAASAAAAHTDWGSQATTSNEVDGPSTAIATGDLISMTTVGVIQKLTDSGVPAAHIPIGNLGSAGLSGTSPIVVAATGAISCPTCSTATAAKGIVTATYTNATTGQTAITGLSIALAANTNYAIHCALIWQQSALGSLIVSSTGPAAPTKVTAESNGAANPGAGAGFFQAADGATFGFSLTAGTAGTTNADLYATVEIGVLNGANAGTFQLTAASTAAATLTIQPGSFCTAQ